MTFNEYYKFPEGTNAFFLFPPSFYDSLEPNFPCSPDMKNAFYYYQGYSIPKLDTSKVTSLWSIFQCIQNITVLNVSGWDTSNVTNMESVFNTPSKLIQIDGLGDWVTSNVTNMNFMFKSCSKITSLDLSSWDVSNVTKMDSMFDSCNNLTSIDFMENWDTSKVTTMSNIFNGLKCKIPAIKCDSLNMSSYSGLIGYSENKDITELGGFLNLKCSLSSDNNLKRLPNLTYESCINVLNGLYDFTGNGVTPASNEGKLKVHSNFLTLVGEQINIGTNKGWTITA